MSVEKSALVADRKKAIRRQAHARRASQSEKDALSRRIMANALALPEFDLSSTVMLYVDVRHEVRTRLDLPDLLSSGKRVVVPYCEGEHLSLFHLVDTNHLAVGRFGVLEPRTGLRARAEFQVPIEDVELVYVPGVAFDRHGGRMGHGKGYYDRLLAKMDMTTVFVGLAFECQVFPDVAMQPHDVSMDRVVTESAVYIGRGR